jgi:hypothetical protein
MFLSFQAGCLIIILLEKGRGGQKRPHPGELRQDYQRIRSVAEAEGLGGVASFECWRRPLPVGGLAPPFFTYLFINKPAFSCV